jgi:hypothetical protein
MNDEELHLRRIAARADRARAIIEDDLLVGAFEALDARYLMAWRNSPADQPEMRERLWHHLQALAEVRAELNRVLEDGEMARAALDDLRAGITNP